MNETINVLMKRKSVRVYEDREIPQEAKEAILAAAMRAPTAGNSMLYSILDVTDQALKDKLAETCDHQPFIASAPLVLVFLADYRRWVRKFHQAGCEEVPAPRLSDLILATNDTVIAAHAACVAAESLGIGSCYIGDILEQCETHRALLHLPEYVVPAAMLVFGYPTRQQQEREKPARCDLRHIVHENAYRPMDGAELEEMLAHQAGERPYADWLRAFCQRKYNSGFSREMSRSAAVYLEQFRPHS